MLATQRPSVNVITGLIKANITSRCAFNTASLVDSRTIIDMSGAEKLLGRGDMLYLSADTSKPKRLQGAFVTEEEVSRVAKYLKSKAKAEYEEEVVSKQSVNFMPSESNHSADEDEDELIPEAKDVIMKAKKASASLLQRRLRIGYARAARILDILEEQGFIGPSNGAKPREILMDLDEYEESMQAEEANDEYEEDYTDEDDDSEIVEGEEDELYEDDNEDHDDSDADEVYEDDDDEDEASRD